MDRQGGTDVVGRVEGWIQRDILQPMEDFQNPRQEWRRLFSELLGTFFLVLVAAGGGMMGHAFPDTISRTAAVVAPGLMVMAIILFMGKVSGAHLNPAVSVAFALRGDFPWRRVHPILGLRRRASRRRDCRGRGGVHTPRRRRRTSRLRRRAGRPLHRDAPPRSSLNRSSARDRRRGLVRPVGTLAPLLGVIV